jgi:hypothetical protein
MLPSSLHIITSLAIVTTIHCLPSKLIIQVLNFFYLHKSIFTKNMIQENVTFLTFPLLKNNTHPWLFFSPYLSIFTCSSVDSASTFVSSKSLYKGTCSFVFFVAYTILWGRWGAVGDLFMHVSLFFKQVCF